MQDIFGPATVDIRRQFKDSSATVAQSDTRGSPTLGSGTVKVASRVHDHVGKRIDSIETTNKIVQNLQLPTIAARAQEFKNHPAVADDVAPKLGGSVEISGRIKCQPTKRIISPRAACELIDHVFLPSLFSRNKFEDRTAAKSSTI